MSALWSRLMSEESVRLDVLSSPFLMLLFIKTSHSTFLLLFISHVPFTFLRIGHNGKQWSLMD